MLNLISIELMKLFRRGSTWVMLLLLIGVIIAFSFINARFMPEGQQSVWFLMQDSSFLISLITLFTIIVAGGMVAGEFTTGTIKLLLIRPVSRTKILVAKFIATFVFALILLVILFVASFLLALGIYGWDSLQVPIQNNLNGELVAEQQLRFILGLYALNSVNLMMMTTLAFTISTVFRSSSLAIGLSLFVNFIGMQIAYLLSQYDWVKYILFTHLDFTQHFYTEPFVEGVTLSFSIVTVLIYFLLFVVLSGVVFKKRDVTA